MSSLRITPNDNDILLGRGGNNNKHVGNEQLRNLARGHVHVYRKASKKEKSNISRSLVNHIRNLGPSGRFLKKDTTSKCWQDVGDDIAREKASQALRDAVSELSKGGNLPNQQHLCPLSPPSIPTYPNIRKHDYVNDRMDHKRRRCCSTNTTILHHNHQPIGSPPTIQLSEGKHSSPTAVSSSYDRYGKRPPPPVVTPDDPEHWRQNYSSNDNSSYINRFRTQAHFTQIQYGFPDHDKLETSNPTVQWQVPSTRRTDSIALTKTRVQHPESTPSYISSDSYYDHTLSNLPENDRFDDLELFEW